MTFWLMITPCLEIQHVMSLLPPDPQAEKTLKPQNIGYKLNYMNYSIISIDFIFPIDV